MYLEGYRVDGQVPGGFDTHDTRKLACSFHKHAFDGKSDIYRLVGIVGIVVGTMGSLDDRHVCGMFYTPLVW